MKLLLAGFAGAVTAVVAGPAETHSWYPQRCCNDQDCVKVERLERREDGSYKMTAGPIDVIVPKGFPIEASRDGDAHVCVYRNLQGHYIPRCVFLPGEV